MRILEGRSLSGAAMPAAAYALGLMSLFAADLVVANRFPAEEVALWAETRSLLGVASVACLLGLDLVFVRAPASSARLLRMLALQLPVMALVVAFSAWSLGFLTSLWSALLLTLAGGWSVVFYQYLRATNHLAWSQACYQLWKIVALVWIVAIAGSPDPGLRLDWVIALSVLATVALGLVGLIRHRPATFRPQTPEPVSDLYAIGSRFWVTSTLLALSVYGEQLLVNHFDQPAAGGRYFAHLTYFVFPASFGAGYLGFVLAPWLRDHRTTFVRLMRSHWGWALAAVVVYAVVLNAIGLLGWSVMRPLDEDPSAFLQVVFLFVCIGRTLYLVPSAFIGVHGSLQDHNLIIGGYVVSMALAVAVIALLRVTFALPLSYCVAVGALTNWVGRTTAGTAVTLRGVRRLEGS